MTAVPVVERPGPGPWPAVGGEAVFRMGSFRACKREEENPRPDWEAASPLTFGPVGEKMPEAAPPGLSVPASPRRLGVSLLLSLAAHTTAFLVLLFFGAAPAVLAPEAGGLIVLQVGLGGFGGSGGAGGGPPRPAGGGEKGGAPARAPLPGPEPASLVGEPKKIPIKPLIPFKPLEKKPEHTAKPKGTAAKAPAAKPVLASAAENGQRSLAPGKTGLSAADGPAGQGSVPGSGGGLNGIGTGPGSSGQAGAGGGEESGAGYAKGNYRYIRKRILQHLVYPPQALRMGLQGTVTLSFLIDREGRANDIRVIGSSGYDHIDQSALEAVRNASPFPPPPESARIVIPIGLKLK